MQGFVKQRKDFRFFFYVEQEVTEDCTQANYMI